MDSLEFIDNYFKSALSPEQKMQFIKRIEEDPVFAEEVAFYTSVHKVAKDQLIEDKKRKFRELYQQALPVRYLKPHKRVWTYAAAAATLGAIVLGWYLYVQTPSQEKLAEMYIEKNLQTIGVTMRTSPDSLQSALRLYNDGELQKSLQQLEAIIRSDTADFTAKKYAGIVSLRLEQYDKALGYFKQLEGYTGLFSNPGKFYQALTYMKRNQPGDIELAKLLLLQVVKSDLDGKETARQWVKEL